MLAGMKASQQDISQFPPCSKGKGEQAGVIVD